MPKIKNMGHATARFNEGIIISGSAGTDTAALVVTGSTVISGSESRPALDLYGNLSGEYVAIIDNDENSSGHVLKLLTDGNGSGSRVLEMIDGDGDTIFRARADGRFGFGPDGVSSMGAGTFVVGIDNSSHTADIAISQRLQHLGDSNTYLDFPSNDNITFAAGGSEELKIASDAVLVKEYIKHDGDDNTYIRFQEDQLHIRAGGDSMIKMKEDASNQILILSGGGGTSPDPDSFTDTNFFVSGSIDSAGSSVAGTSVFGGDVVASGSITTKFGLAVEGYIAINQESSTPSQPPDGQGYLYSKTDGKLYWRSHDVSETDLTASGGGGGSGAKAPHLGFVSIQTTARVVSYDYTNLSGTANNNVKGFLIAPFNGTLDTVIVSTKGTNLDAGNTGNVTVYAYKNQDNFASSTDVTVAHDGFSQKASGTPNIYSGIFDFSLSVSQGDLIQLKVGKSAGSNQDAIITAVFTES